MNTVRQRADVLQEWSTPDTGIDPNGIDLAVQRPGIGSRFLL